MRRQLTCQRILSTLLWASMALYCCVANSIEFAPDAVLSKTISERSPRILIGSAVKIQEKRGREILVADGSGNSAWVAADAVIPIRFFRPISKWHGPKELEVGDGDYEAVYRFKDDASFSVKETEQTAAETYRLVVRKGHLFSYKNFIWAKRLDGRLYSSRIFIKSEAGKICWQEYADDRC